MTGRGDGIRAPGRVSGAPGHSGSRAPSAHAAPSPPRAPSAPGGRRALRETRSPRTRRSRSRSRSPSRGAGAKMHTTQKDTTYTKIFVGGLPYHTTDASLRKYFEVFGDIEEAVVITDRQTGKSRGYGFVSYTKRGLGVGKGQLREVLAGRSKTGHKGSCGPRPLGVRAGVRGNVGPPGTPPLGAELKL